MIYSCDNPLSAENDKNKIDYDEFFISGRILYPDGEPASNVRVYFSNSIYTFAFPYKTYKDTLTTDDDGYYYLDTLTYLGDYSIIPVKYEISDNNHYSYICDLQNIDIMEADSNYSVEDIYLESVQENNSMSGTVIFKESINPANNTLVTLSQLFCSYQLVDTIRTDIEGNFLFENISSGTYHVSVSEYDTCLSSRVVATSKRFYCSENNHVKIDTLELYYMPVYKPVIYIYPEEASQFQVNLKFKNGISLYESIPEYNESWNVFVEENGMINYTYNYLFYEVLISEIPELYYGYCIRKYDIENDLTGILTNIGFETSEIKDFVEYWKNKLTEYDYYRVYPIMNESLDQFVELNITPQPNNILRAWLFFEGCDNYVSINPPQIESILRDRTLVVEWGGSIIK